MQNGAILPPAPTVLYKGFKNWIGRLDQQEANKNRRRGSPDLTVSREARNTTGR